MLQVYAADRVNNMKLKIYMKSGNTITLPYIKDYTIGYQGNTIVKLGIEVYAIANILGLRPRLHIGATDLSQIEAIVRL